MNRSYKCPNNAGDSPVLLSQMKQRSECPPVMNASRKQGYDILFKEKICSGERLYISSNPVILS